MNEVGVDGDSVPWAAYDATALPAEEWRAAEGAMEGNQPGLFFSVSSGQREVREAIESFRQTGKDILSARRRDAYPPPPREKLPDSQTCDACDLRYSCTTACEVHLYR